MSRVRWGVLGAASIAVRQVIPAIQASKYGVVTALASRDTYNEALSRSHRGSITTEIHEAGDFYYAEDYHQQYLEKNPGGYCGIGGTGVSCPVGLAR
jgi:peptide methionine sulfoxide reductase MsrA